MVARTDSGAGGSVENRVGEVGGPGDFLDSSFLAARPAEPQADGDKDGE